MVVLNTFSMQKSSMVLCQSIGMEIPRERIINGVYKKRKVDVFTIAEESQLKANFGEVDHGQVKKADPLSNGYNYIRHQWSYVLILVGMHQNKNLTI